MIDIVMNSKDMNEAIKSKEYREKPFPISRVLDIN